MDVIIATVVKIGMSTYNSIMYTRVIESSLV